MKREQGATPKKIRELTKTEVEEFKDNPVFMEAVHDVLEELTPDEVQAKRKEVQGKRTKRLAEEEAQTKQHESASASSGLSQEERNAAKEQTSTLNEPKQVMVRPFEIPKDPPPRPTLPENIKELIKTWSQDLTEKEVRQIYGERMKEMNEAQGAAERNMPNHKKKTQQIQQDWHPINWKITHKKNGRSCTSTQWHQ